mmetsp:Transcript_18810/g.40422  ORF Transcript_18810/g.40422 Transcript_18810/m.40422 type:complete len:99 (+) Transcript_18810:691-987(+)
MAENITNLQLIVSIQHVVRTVQSLEHSDQEGSGDVSKSMEKVVVAVEASDFNSVLAESLGPNATKSTVMSSIVVPRVPTSHRSCASSARAIAAICGPL